jgi:hypothetical protein
LPLVVNIIHYLRIITTTVPTPVQAAELLREVWRELVEHRQLWFGEEAAGCKAAVDMVASFYGGTMATAAGVIRMVVSWSHTCGAR